MLFSTILALFFGFVKVEDLEKEGKKGIGYFKRI